MQPPLREGVSGGEDEVREPWRVGGRERLLDQLGEELRVVGETLVDVVAPAASSGEAELEELCASGFR